MFLHPLLQERFFFTTVSAETLHLKVPASIYVAPEGVSICVTYRILVY